MRELYIQIGKDIAKSRRLQELAIDEDNYKMSNELHELQDEIYKRTLFTKNYLKARQKITDRERTKNY